MNNSKKIAIITIIIITIILIITMAWYLPKKNPENNKDTKSLLSDNITDHDADIDTKMPYMFYYFSSPKCVHCKKFNPIWTQLEKRLEDINNIALKKINVNDPKNTELVDYYNIKSMPTLILVTPDKTIEYEGDRDLEYLYDFIVKNYYDV
jgi:thiol-disulfide isomerase/thioredoxin